MTTEPRPATTELDHAASAFASVRPRLFGIAYRMLASSMEADDIVQEVWLRWQACDRSAVLDAPAFLATTTTRLAINAVKSARSRHETYIGPWLPEPVDTSADPGLGAERGEALELAVLLLLEKLSPTERAAYVLREAFEYPYAQIADILQLNEAGVRQLVSRARKHLTEERRAAVSSSDQRRLLEAFVAAAQTGEITTLEALFAEDVVSLADGGGSLRASRVPVLGRSRVARFISGFAAFFWAGVTLTRVEANGQASVLISKDGVASALLTVNASDQGIDQLLWVMNPTKLAGFTPPSGPEPA
jgi:RNA polymerase sigma-70 factor, ECF subfamily